MTPTATTRPYRVRLSRREAHRRHDAHVNAMIYGVERAARMHRVSPATIRLWVRWTDRVLDRIAGKGAR
jgi:hypothetical protein